MAKQSVSFGITNGSEIFDTLHEVSQSVRANKIQCGSILKLSNDGLDIKPIRTIRSGRVYTK
jgi:hypothetical protein